MPLVLDSTSATAVYSGIMFFMVSGREKIECVVSASALLVRARIPSLSPYGLLACFRKYAAEVEAAALDKYARGEVDRLGRLIVDDLSITRARASARQPLAPEAPTIRAPQPPPAARSQAPIVAQDAAAAFKSPTPAVAAQNAAATFGSPPPAVRTQAAPAAFTSPMPAVRPQDAPPVLKSPAPVARPPDEPPALPQPAAASVPALPALTDIDPWESWPIAVGGRR